MKNEWEIKSRSHACSRTGKEFKKGAFFYTLLYREAEGFRREDLCEEAWAARTNSASENDPQLPQPLPSESQQQQELPPPFSFWRSRYEPPAPPQPEPLNKKDGESVLRHLITENLPAHTNFIYILALLLERKRVLRPIEGEDANTLVYEHAQTGEVFLIRNPHLSLDQIPAIQREVAELLQGLNTQN